MELEQNIDPSRRDFNSGGLIKMKLEQLKNEMNHKIRSYKAAKDEYIEIHDSDDIEKLYSAIRKFVFAAWEVFKIPYFASDDNTLKCLERLKGEEGIEFSKMRGLYSVEFDMLRSIQ